jgi:hypothetical protein
LNFSKSRVQAGSVPVEESSTKGGETGQRRVILAIPERKLLEAHRAKQKAELERLGLPTPISNFMFTQPDGSPTLSFYSCPNFFKKSQRKSEFTTQRPSRPSTPTCHPHFFKKASLCTSLRNVSGHRDAMVTATIYAHVYNEQAESAAATFSNSFHRGA